MGWIGDAGILGAMIAVLLVGDAAAQVPSGIAGPGEARVADPVLDAARTLFEALPEPERKALQNALIWTGDFNGTVSGAFGRRTGEALQAFGARSGVDPLSREGRAAILLAGESARREAGFRVQEDPVSGANLGVPEAVLPKRTALARGTRWQSADGRVTVETRAFPPEHESLDSLFERVTAPLAGRRVTYRLRKPDFFVVAAETGAGLSYIRYAAGPQGVRGLLMGYERALAHDVDRLVIAMANAFDPFPAGSPPANTAAPAAVAGTAPVPAPPPEAVPAPTAAAMPPAAGEAATTATGLRVAPGRLLTAAEAVAGCPGLRAGSQAARVVAEGTGLALVEWGEERGAPSPVLPSPRMTGMTEDDAVIALAEGAEGTTAVPGTVAHERITAPLQPGAAGAPILDREGRLVGLVASSPERGPMIAGVAPPTSVALVPVEAVVAFLAKHGIPEAGLVTTAGGDRDTGLPAVLEISCR